MTFVPQTIETNNCNFFQELSLIDKSELMTLITGGLELYLDKKGGLAWKTTNFRNSILITMDIFDLIDI